MNNSEENTIGKRVREMRKRKGLNQQELADILGKSLRTVQKYENGEINISVGMVNTIAKVLETSSSYLLGYKKDGAKIECMSDIMSFLFCLEKVSGIKFGIDVKKPPKNDGWECSINFNGKDLSADLNSDMCLFLEDWANMREEFYSYSQSRESYDKWKDQTLAYYSSLAVETKEPEDMSKNERITKRNEYLKALYENPDNTL